MLTPCENILKGFLPAIKAGVAKELAKRGFTQVDIAAQLGLTQAAVSKYLSGNYSDSIKQLENNRQIRESAKEIAKSLQKMAKRNNAASGVCATCEQFLGGKCSARKK